MLHNLEIKKCLYLVLATLLAMIGLVGLAALGFDIPVLRQIVGFIFLTFVPGILILRILKVRNINTAESLVYSVGLSVAFIMFVGFFMNMLYPLIGISKPISIYPVIITITVIVLILCGIAYKREASEAKPPPRAFSIRWSELLSSPVLLLLLLPILSALGAFWVYLHHNNVLLFILLSLIAFVVTLVAFGKFIPTRLYSLAIMSISIALVWHVCLLSFYLPAGDVIHALRCLESVLNNSIWNPAIGINANAMLSVVMLGTIYPLVLKLDIVWVLKIVYPFFLMLVPLALFEAYRKQLSDRISFLAAFFFMSWTPFFSGMALVMRMPTAELFLALSILLFVSKEMPPPKRVPLLLILSLSIVVSHYGTSYIYMLYLIIALPLLFLYRSSTANDLWQRIAARFRKLIHRVSITSESPKLVSGPLPQNTLTGTYVLLFILFCLAWYMYVSSGAPLHAIVSVGQHVYRTMGTEFFYLWSRDAHVVQAMGMMPMRGDEIEWEIARVFQYFTQLFVLVGIAGLIANWRKTRFHHEYIAMSVVSMVIIGLCIILPYFAAQLNMTRIYHLTLFFLAPLCVLGGIATFRWLFRVLRLHRLRDYHTHLKLMVISVLVPYFLFTTGFIFDLTGATPTSMSLSFYKGYWPLFTGGDIHASQWIKDTIEPGCVVYSDSFGMFLLTGAGVKRKGGLPEHLGQGEYIFLRYWSVKHSQLLVPSEEKLVTLTSNSRIYDNGWTQVFAPR